MYGKIMNLIVGFVFLFSLSLAPTVSSAGVSTQSEDTGGSGSGASCHTSYHITHHELVDALETYDSYSSLTGFLSLFNFTYGLVEHVTGTSSEISYMRTAAYNGQNLHVCVETNPDYNGYNTATVKLYRSY